MPELCRIYEPAFDNHEDKWVLHSHIVTYRAGADGWVMQIMGDKVTVLDFGDMQKVADIVADHNGLFTDYREARNYIARSNA